MLPTVTRDRIARMHNTTFSIFSLLDGFRSSFGTAMCSTLWATQSYSLSIVELSSAGKPNSTADTASSRRCSAFFSEMNEATAFLAVSPPDWIFLISSRENPALRSTATFSKYAASSGEISIALVRYWISYRTRVPIRWQYTAESPALSSRSGPSPVAVSFNHQSFQRLSIPGFLGNCDCWLFRRYEYPSRKSPSGFIRPV